jgi:catechol 2,3-dioxygenase-like lactoylglutathione lyase family enzyme
VHVRRAMPVLTTTDPDAARAFYEGLLGMRVAMAQDGMLMFASTTVPTTQLIVVWRSPTALDPHVCDVDLSIEVDDVDAAHELAVRQGLRVLRPLTDEPWGIRRFFVRDPTGARVNVASHRPGRQV